MREDNLELIKRCREAIKGPDEPHSDEWYDMVEGLCNALEKRELDWEAMMRVSTPHGAVWENVEGS